MNQLEKLEAEARRLGCGWFGVAPAEALNGDLATLEEWLEAGRHGDMAWLARDPARRCDPEKVVEGCRSVVVLGLNYLREDSSTEISPPPPGMGRISKYAQTRDYHRVCEKILKRLARFIDSDLSPGATTRGYVDYGPVLERPWAARAGIGFVGKHTLLIHPTQGSYHFLAVLLTTAALHGPDEIAVDATGCGDCRRCIDACPTGAITEPWKLDARKCLSYLTIEKKGPVEEEFWSQTSGFIFGCDICQDVCPYNRKRAIVQQAPSPLGPLLVPSQVSLAELIRNSAGFLSSLGDVATPLKRAGADSLTRNALAAASTGCDGETVDAIRALITDDSRPHWLREMAGKVLNILAENSPDSGDD